MPKRLHLFPDQDTAHTWNGWFSCAIYFGQQQYIGSQQCWAEFLPEGLRPSIAVWLEDNHQSAIGPHKAGSAQSGVDFGRVMAVIIDHDNSTGFSLHLEPTLDATKVVQRLSNAAKGNIQFPPRRDCGQGIPNVVRARNVEYDRTQILAMPCGNEYTS